MDMKQILIFGLVLVPVWTYSSRCYDEDKVSEAADKRLRTHRQHGSPSPAAVSDSPAECPVKLYERLSSKSLEERSLSPWRYVHVSNKDYFPSTYVQADCLCSGCILVQDRNQGSPVVVESHDYNSVPIEQTRMFLKRELCSSVGEDGRKQYRLVPVYVKVVVGCTCARVNTAP
ncbi:interleukin-17C [Anabas testudineus]|uniref:interleukin-17C n=1 Tax=Anabas testudineus TaxID=64144 RepID=UPI000E466089|nr:interleukin-17C [Anabas testudineus]